MTSNTTDTDKRLTFIGGGNMARSLIGGLSDHYRPDSICVADPVPEIRTALEQDFSVRTGENNETALAGASCVVLAIKPQLMKEILVPLAEPIAKARPLLVSIAAGIRVDSMIHWLNGYDNIVRVMPNTPALVKLGASGLFATARVSDDDRNTAESIMAAVGTTAWVENEQLIDVVTALSGSGPAYFFYMLEAMTAKAVELGLSADTARDLALQTAIGAAELARQSPETFETLRRNVTSPGGTTEAAIESMEARGGRDVIATAVEAAARRSEELAEVLGK